MDKKVAKKDMYIEVEPHLRKIREHEENEERAFHRLAQAMGYRLPGAEPRRRQHIRHK